MFSILLATFFILAIVDTKLSVNRLPISRSHPLCEKCVIPVVLQSKAQNVHLICAKNASCPSDIVNIISDFGITWTFYREQRDMVVAFEWKDVCVLFADNVANSVQQLELFPKCHKTRVIVSLSHSSGMDSLFQHSWKMGVTDVVAVVTKGPDCQVFSYFPFGPMLRCYNTSPVMLDSWKKNQSCALTIGTNLNLFPDKVSNLHSCQFRIEYYALGNRPYYIKVSHRWLDIVPFLKTALNFNAILVPTTEGKFFPNKFDNRSALLCTSFYQTSDRLKKFTLSPVSWAIHICLCLPVREMSSVQWFRIFKEFTWPVWSALVICFVVIVVYRRSFSLEHRNDTMFVICSSIQELVNVSILSNSGSRWQHSMVLRSWLVSCFILNAAYQSNLESKLAVSFVDDVIKNMEDFLASDLPITMSTRAFYSLFDVIYSKPEHRRIRKKFNIVNESNYLKMLSENWGKSAFFCEYQFMSYEFPDHSYKALPGETTKLHQSLMLLPKPSPFERAFIRAILKCFDAGAFAYMYLRQDPVSAYVNQKTIRGRQPIRLKTLSSVFVFWMVGCFLALVTLVVEISANRV